MFRITLNPVFKGDDILILTPSALFRILFAIIFAILWSGMTAFSEGSIPLFGLIIMGVALIAIVYEERWIFDRNQKTIEFRMGLLFLNRKVKYSFNDIEEFSFVTLQQGKIIDPALETARFGSRYTLFGLVTKTGDKRSIEMLKSRLAPGLKQKADQVSRFCEIPLRDEHPNG